MPGSLSSQGLAAVFGQQTDAEFVCLLTITHQDLSLPIRLCSGGIDVVSRGETFLYFPFDLQAPSSVPDAPPQGRLVIGNVDRRIVEAVRSLSGDLDVAFELVLASQPSTVEEGPVHLTLRNVDYDEIVLQADLQPEPILTEPCPPDRYTPSRNPALFRGTAGASR